MTPSVQKATVQVVSWASKPNAAEMTTTPNARPPTMMPWTVPSSSGGVVSNARPSVQVS